MNTALLMRWLKGASFKPKLITLLIFGAVMVVAARVEGMLDRADLSTARQLAELEPAAGGEEAEKPEAQTSIPVTEKKPETTDGSKPPTDAGSGDGMAMKPDEKAPEQAENKPLEAPISDAVPRDPSLFTDAEIQVLQQLGKRRRELDERERGVELREGLLKAAEDRVEAKILELAKLRKIVTGLIEQNEAASKKKIEALVKIYEKMKPKSAARIFEQLDMPILLSVVQGMKESKVAPILAAMDPKRAQEVTAELAERKYLLDPPTAENES